LANENHLEILKKGVDIWNKWRQENPSVEPDLSSANLGGEILFEADLCRANLSKADLSSADLCQANLFEANLNGAKASWGNFFKAYLRQAKLIKADLREADLSQADLAKANLSNADLSEADLIQASLYEADLTEANLFEAVLRKADLNGANFTKANLTRADLENTNLLGANLTEANLTGAKLVGAFLAGAVLSGANLSQADLTLANLSHADLTRVDFTGSNMIGTMMLEPILDGAILSGCRVYGISAWKLKGLETAKQSNLIITYWGEPVVTVDNLEVAQFLHILRNNEKVNAVIDAITSKVVLILGRFTPERKAILNAIRDELRKRNYQPIVFDFDEPENRDLLDTVKTMAHMSHFVIADITDPRCVPQELESFVPGLAVPVQPILLSSANEYATFEHYKRLYHWVLEIYRYNDLDDLLNSLGEKVIVPAEEKAKELQK
jgi:uncharacterized protein YjbI with pentapeptide repeats